MKRFWTLLEIVYKNWKAGKDNRDVFGVANRLHEVRCSALVEKIPSVKEDIDEGLSCYRFGRGTGAVFHFSRAAEASLNLLSRKLKCSRLVDRPSWQHVTDRLNAHLNGIPAKTKIDVARRKQLSAIIAHLSAVRITWRNDVMHPSDNYALDEAKQIIGNILLLVEAIASVVGSKRKLSAAN